jgi:hypothetical protein
MCDIHTGGLEPLAHLPNLRELVLDGCCNDSAQAIVQLLSSSVQGRLLKIQLCGSVDQTVVDKAISAHATLKGKRGRALVPQLEVVRYRVAEAGFSPVCTVTLH